MVYMYIKHSESGSVPGVWHLFGRSSDPDEIEVIPADPAARIYDSSLSKPGRICRNCRSLVAGWERECPVCRARS
jgi:hypothetical protein